MAKIYSNIQEKVYTLDRFKGLNEAKEGELTLKSGEAAVMRNFKVTPAGALCKRGGTKTVAGLLASYFVNELAEHEFLTEHGSSTFSVEVHQTATVDSAGNIVFSGNTGTLTRGNASTYVGWYFQHNGKLYRFKGFTAEE
jgi:hypothetical protein